MEEAQRETSPAVIDQRRKKNWCFGKQFSGKNTKTKTSVSGRRGDTPSLVN